MVILKVPHFLWSVLLACIFCPVMHADTISNYNDWNQNIRIGYFTGTSHDPFSSYATFGETFQASASNSVLNSITFYIDNSSDSPINLFAEVSAWNGQNLAGSALFASSPVTVATNASAFQVVTVPTGNLVLAPGSEYIAFFSTIGLSNIATAEASFGAVTKDTVPNSDFKTNRGTTADGLYTQGNWGGGGSSEIAFTLQFGVVPEPSAWTMLSVGAMGAGVAALRRRRGGLNILRPRSLAR